MTLSGWVHRRQLIVIEFLKAENRMLEERQRASASDSAMRNEHCWLERQRLSGEKRFWNSIRWSPPIP
jgi:hypothetical protein